MEFFGIEQLMVTQLAQLGISTGILLDIYLQGPKVVPP